MGRKYFPSFSAVIDKYVLDDDLADPMDDTNMEAQLLRKKRFAELTGILQDSVQKTKNISSEKSLKAHEKPVKAHEKPVKAQKKPAAVLSSSSSTSSSRGTSGSMITKM